MNGTQITREQIPAGTHHMPAHTGLTQAGTDTQEEGRSGHTETGTRTYRDTQAGPPSQTRKPLNSRPDLYWTPQK